MSVNHRGNKHDTKARGTVVLFTVYAYELKHDVAASHIFRTIFHFLRQFNCACMNIVASSTPRKPDPPKVVEVGKDYAKISLEAPPTSKVIIYLVKYRKVGEIVWRTVTETSSTTLVCRLHPNTHYEITVAAKYQGGKFGPASDPLKVQTKRGGTGKGSFKDVLY